MDWQQIKQQLERNCDFFNRIEVSSSHQPDRVAIHPLAQMSASLAIRAISLGNKGRLVILLPTRLNCAKWIATLCTMSIMKQDYEKDVKVTKYSLGQKLLVKKCVVEYLGEEFDANYNRWYMWVRCKDGKNRIPLDRALVFQPIASDRPLSSIQTVGYAVNSAQQTNSQIDNILRIQTMGNKSIFKTNIILASRIGETVDFIRENQINGSPIINLFLWGKLDAEGNASTIEPKNIQANPCCLVSPDLIGVSHFICDQPEVTQGIIIDGAKDYSNNLPLFDDILDKSLPVVVIADILEAEYLTYFSDRGFRIWQWNKKNIIQSGSIVEQNKSIFSNLNNSLINYCNQKVRTIDCEHQIIEQIAKRAMELKRLIPHDHHNIDRDYYKMIQIINELSRLIRIPDQNWNISYMQTIQSLWQQFKPEKIWLSDKAIQYINATLTELISLTKEPFEGDSHKPARFYELLNKYYNSDQIAVIVAKSNEVEITQQYWQKQIGDKQLANIHFFAPEFLGQYVSFTPDYIIICGWLGKDRMSELIHSYIVPNIIMLMYPFELEYFRSANIFWEKRNEVSIHAIDFSDIFGLSEKELGVIEHDIEASTKTPIKEEFDIADFELKLRNYRYQNYTLPTEDSGGVVLAKLTVFASKKFSFLTESHKLPVVTDVIREEDFNGEIPRKNITQLHAGDYILFQESNRDIIREIADKGLAKNGQSEMRKVASLWKDALLESYMKMSNDINAIIELLRRAGCRRHPQTIRNWIFDDQIGPRTLTDLSSIAKALPSSKLAQRITEVKAAISIVRGAHLQASTYIRNKLLSTLPEIISAGKTSGITSGVVLLNLDEFGQVAILRIEEIEKEWQEIPINNVNRLLAEEE